MHVVGCEHGDYCCDEFTAGISAFLQLAVLGTPVEAYLDRRSNSVHDLCSTKLATASANPTSASPRTEAAYLYSSLIPYATTTSGSSTRTLSAAAFMRSSARRSLGFLNLYLSENLRTCQYMRIILLVNSWWVEVTCGIPVHQSVSRSTCLGGANQAARKT